jgi:nucleoside phosphorylase
LNIILISLFIANDDDLFYRTLEVKMERIGIISAMPVERRAILKHSLKFERSKLGQLSCFRFSLSGRNCILVESGIGIKRAMYATSTLIATYRPGLIVSCGIAGAAEDDLRIGDVVAADKTFVLDEKGAGIHFSLHPLSDMARISAGRALEKLGARLVSGTVITTRMSNAEQSLPAGTIHPVFDMETTGIAHAASEHGIAVMGLRAVSDGPSAPLSFDIGKMTDEDYNLYISKAARMVIRNPRLLLGTFRILRNARTAATNAAAALAAALQN